MDIVECYMQGDKPRNIAKKFRVSAEDVYKIIQKFKLELKSL